MTTVAASGIPVRPLPRRIRPYPDETTRSLIRRLENANSLHPGQLQRTLRRSRRPWIETLASWTGYEPEVLSLAMPQLGQHTSSSTDIRRLIGRPNRTVQGLACHRCTLSRGAGRYVEIYTSHERVICPSHSVWLGGGVHGFMDQLPIQACPDITSAWHHHKNIITRFGRSPVRKGFHTSTIINWRWYDQFHHFNTAREHYDLLSIASPKHSKGQAIVAASLYPTIVSLTAALASPFWAEIAHSRQPDRFLNRISEQITNGWTPQGAFDPLLGWMLENWSPGFPRSDTINPAKRR